MANAQLPSCRVTTFQLVADLISIQFSRVNRQIAHKRSVFLPGQDVHASSVVLPHHCPDKQNTCRVGTVCVIYFTPQYDFISVDNVSSGEAVKIVSVL